VCRIEQKKTANYLSAFVFVLPIYICTYIHMYICQFTLMYINLFLKMYNVWSEQMYGHEYTVYEINLFVKVSLKYLF